jgi:hypothetical protein
MCAVILVTLSACINPWDDLENQAQCRANLSGIGKAIALYRGEDRNAKFPLLLTRGQPEANIRAGDAAKSLDELRTNLAGHEAAMQNVWMIISKGLAPEEGFMCPSDGDYKLREFENADQRRARKYGWHSSANFSYGLHFPYKFTKSKGAEVPNEAWLGNQLKGSFVVMADKNPSRTNEPAVGVGTKKSPSNHPGSGEAYLMYSGAVDWKKGAENSDVNGDDIYTIETEINENPATPADYDDQYITRHPLDD